MIFIVPCKLIVSANSEEEALDLAYEAGADKVDFANITTFDSAEQMRIVQNMSKTAEKNHHANTKHG